MFVWLFYHFISGITVCWHQPLRQHATVITVLTVNLAVPPTTEYAQVTKMLGNGRLEAMCFDGVKRLCHIRGKLRKKVELWSVMLCGNVIDRVFYGTFAYLLLFGIYFLRYILWKVIVQVTVSGPPPLLKLPLMVGKWVVPVKTFAREKLIFTYRSVANLMWIRPPSVIVNNTGYKSLVCLPPFLNAVLLSLWNV